MEKAGVKCCLIIGLDSVQDCAWGTNKKLHFSNRRENSRSRSTSTSSCDVGNKYVCVVGWRSGVAFFTVARVVFKLLFEAGACEDSDQKCMLLREFILREKKTD